jgi:hypothetical protein
MPFLKRPSGRRRVFLNLIAEIEGGLRTAFERWAKENNENQSGLAKKLGVDRSAVNRRLTGRVNLTIQTIADMVWALGYCIRIEIYHPSDAAVFRNQALIPTDNVPAPVPVGARETPTQSWPVTPITPFNLPRAQVGTS